MIYNPYDYYFNKAKQDGYKARSIFKLEEIQEKFQVITKDTKIILDIGCSPGSRMQYSYTLLNRYKAQNFQIIGFDLLESTVNLSNVFHYVQDVTNIAQVDQILQSHNIVSTNVDFIQSDMAPNTVGHKSVDAIRSIGLLENTLRIYKKYLKPNGKFVIKVFMGPGFDEFVANLKEEFGSKNIKIFKPKACRSISKETYIIKI